MTEELDSRAILLKSISNASDHILSRRGDDNSSIRERTGDIFCPDIDSNYLISKLDKLRLCLENRDPTSLNEHSEKLKEYSNRINFWVSNIERHLYDRNYAQQTIFCLLLIIDEIELFLEEETEPIDPKSYQKQLSKIRQNIESLERSVQNSESELGDVKNSIDTILKAHDAALALPETLETLTKTNSKVHQIHDEISAFRNTAEKSHDFIKEVDESIHQKQNEIQEILKKCNDALRASTGVGLAAAFSKHAETLRTSSQYWVGALFFSFIAMVAIGLWRINSILNMMEIKNPDTSIITLNMIFSLFLLAAPIWLAWIAAKRIAHLFRLIEDYEFKAAISSSYEGYRREAARFADKNFTERILNSALTRFDEPPLRFVEKNEPAHPIFGLIELLLFKKQKEEKTITPNTSTSENKEKENVQ